MSLLHKATHPWALDEAAFLLCRFLLYCICRCLTFSHRQQIIRIYLNKFSWVFCLNVLTVSSQPNCLSSSFPCISAYFIALIPPLEFCLMSLSCLCTSLWASGFLCGAESLRIQEKEVATVCLHRIPWDATRKSPVIVIKFRFASTWPALLCENFNGLEIKKHCCKLCSGGGGTCPCCMTPASWS